MICGMGVDWVKMSRIRQALENFGERFQERVYTGLERDFCLSKARTLERKIFSRYLSLTVGVRRFWFRP